MGLHPEVALERIAYYASTVIGLGKATYPAPVNLTETPFLGIFWDDTVIEHRSGIQAWEMTVRGQLVVARLGNLPAEVRIADPLIRPIVDRFQANRDNPAHHLEMPGEADGVDLCHVIRVRPSVRFSYASNEPNSYGAELFWRVKLLRTPGEIQ